MSEKRFVLNKCEDCPYIEVEEYTPNVGFPFVKVFLHCTKTDLYVRGFKSYQNKDGNNNIQLQKLFQYCPLSSSKREFLKWDTGIRSD